MHKRIHGDLNMTIECTIRFKTYSRETLERVFNLVLEASEHATAQHLMGGFFFKTDRSPTAILAAFEDEGFEIADFENIEFRPL
jgi:hypothetical protein